MNKSIVGLIVSVCVLSGCSSFGPGGSGEFDCPGMPKGVVCKTPRQVYEKTDMDKAKRGGKGGVPTYLFATEPRGKDALNPVPVLEQAVVLRVWIAPWIDSNKDLHWPGVMFTEIRPRQWSFGEEQFGGVEPPVPHRSFERGTSRPKAVVQGKNGGAEQPNSSEELN